MKDHVVRYSLEGYNYETVVRTHSSGAAIAWVTNVIPKAHNIYIVEDPVEKV